MILILHIHTVKITCININIKMFWVNKVVNNNLLVAGVKAEQLSPSQAQ